MNDEEKHIRNLILPLPPKLAELAQQLRDFLKKETNPAIEIVFSSYNSINIGYGFTEKAWDCYCGIIIYSKHINISFPSGVSLTDPENILQGTGTKVRHIRIDKFEDIEKPAVFALLKQARENAWIQTANSSDQPKGLKTIIKPKSNNK